MKKYSDEDKKLALMKELCSEIVKAPEGVAAPYLVPRFDRIFKKYFDEEDFYGEIKSAANAFMMSRADKLERAADESPDPVLSAIKYARLGNFIDYGAAPGGIDMEKIDEKLGGALDGERVDPAEYGRLCEDLGNAKELLYITDNAGEIVLDKLLMKKIKSRYKNIKITAAVRGGAVLNDATLRDAEQIRLSEEAEVIDSGSDIPGIQMSEIGAEMRKAMSRADVVISKGQGNFETLSGCGYNVYYVFLCKCDMFVRRFGVPKYTGLIVNERRMPGPA